VKLDLPRRIAVVVVKATGVEVIFSLHDDAAAAAAVVRRLECLGLSARTGRARRGDVAGLTRRRTASVEV
jgi:hypothetical protein